MTSPLLNKLRGYKKLLIVGAYPPPLGGVSIHIYRLNKELNNSNVFDIGKKAIYKGQNQIRLFFEILSNKYDAIHIHSYDLIIIILLNVLRRFKKFHLLATSHNPRLFQDVKTSNIKVNVYKNFISNLDTLIVVGEHVLDEYRKEGVCLPKELIIETAFLPPPIEEETQILKTYPSDLFSFISHHSPLISANAFQIVIHNETDLYGLDLCIELTARLKQDFPTIGFIFALANKNSNIEYLKAIKCKITDLNIEKNFYFLTGQKEIWPLFKKINLMIRPTTTDGDALSIREALYFNCPTISSDVCKRPKESIIFKSRDINDLYIKTKKALYEKTK